MKLTHPKVESVFDDGKFNILIAEAPKAFREFYVDLYSSIQDNDEVFVLSDGDKTVDISKYGLLIADPVNINFNDRRIMNKLYAELGEIAETKFAAELAEINGAFFALLDKLNAESTVEIDWFSDSTVQAMLKSFGVTVKSDFSDIMERLIGYIDMYVRLIGVRFVAFANIRSFFEPKELAELYKYVKYNGIFALSLENCVHDKSADEYTVIIDKDFCEIVA